VIKNFNTVHVIGWADYPNLFQKVINTRSLCTRLFFRQGI